MAHMHLCNAYAGHGWFILCQYYMLRGFLTNCVVCRDEIMFRKEKVGKVCKMCFLLLLGSLLLVLPVEPFGRTTLYSLVVINNVVMLFFI